jgi:hypothetical protein
MSAVTPPLPRWADVFLLPIINLSIALIICGVIIFAIGENPWTALIVMLKGAFVFPGSLGYTLYYTTNFIFTGLAVAVAFHAMMFNIGGEGQAYVGGLGAGLVAVFLAPSLPLLIALPLAIMMAALFGAFWGLVPGYLQAKRGSHIVINNHVQLHRSFSDGLAVVRSTDGARADVFTDRQNCRIGRDGQDSFFVGLRRFQSRKLSAQPFFCVGYHCALCFLGSNLENKARL